MRKNEQRKTEKLLVLRIIKVLLISICVIVSIKCSKHPFKIISNDTGIGTR
jgi:hypothetical protein